VLPILTAREQYFTFLHTLDRHNLFSLIFYEVFGFDRYVLVMFDTRNPGSCIEMSFVTTKFEFVILLFNVLL